MSKSLIIWRRTQQMLSLEHSGWNISAQLSTTWLNISKIKLSVYICLSVKHIWFGISVDTRTSWVVCCFLQKREEKKAVSLLPQWLTNGLLGTHMHTHTDKHPQMAVSIPAQHRPLWTPEGIPLQNSDNTPQNARLILNAKFFFFEQDK